MSSAAVIQIILEREAIWERDVKLLRISPPCQAFAPKMTRVGSVKLKPKRGRR